MPDVRQRVISVVMNSAKPYRAINVREGANRAYKALYEANLLIEGENVEQEVIDAIFASVAAYGSAKTNLEGAELAYNALHSKHLLVKE